MDDAFFAYYERGDERERLETVNELERARTLELLERHLPPPPVDVLDVGGGPGAYARRLAAAGYRVHLVDAVPLHVEQATDAAAGAHTAAVGDARRLAERDESQDAVLLLGPLYHLTEHADRVAALREAWRVLRPGGVVAAAAISRFASALDGFAHRLLGDPDFRAIVERDLREGQHRNPDVAERPLWFTTAYFHRPEELAAEVREAGFELDALLGVEGPGWLFPDRWGDPAARRDVLTAARLLEREPLFSSHFLAVGYRPTA